MSNHALITGRDYVRLMDMVMERLREEQPDTDEEVLFAIAKAALLKPAFQLAWDGLTRPEPSA